MKKPKNENKMLIIIAICLFALIIILTILFQIVLPNISEDEKLVESDDFVPNNEISIDNIHKPSESEWISLQLSRRRVKSAVLCGNIYKQICWR